MTMLPLSSKSSGNRTKEGRMTKLLRKHIRRSITGSMGRFIAIFMIILLGSAFLAGLRLTEPAMLATQENYLAQSSFYDLRVLSSVGLDEACLDALAALDEVSCAEGSVYHDFLTEIDGEELVYRAHTLTGSVNIPTLTAGEMPTQADECLADNLYFSESDIGTTITVSGDGFAYESYTITGLCCTPLYLEISRGSTSLGSGSLSGFVLIPQAGFTDDYYSEIYIVGSQYFAPYSEEYDEWIALLSAAGEEALAEPLAARGESLAAEAEIELADARETLEAEKAAAQAELDEAAAQLAEALETLSDSQSQLDEAYAQLEAARETLEAAAAQIDPDYTSLSDAVAAGWRAYSTGMAALVDAQAQYEQGLNEYQSAAAELAAGKEEYASGLSEYESGKAIYDLAVQAYERAAALLESTADTMTDEAYAQSLAALEAMKAQLDETGAELAAAEEQLSAAAEEIASGEAQLAEAKEQLDAAIAEIAAGTATLTASGEQLTEFEQGVDSYEAGLAEYEAGAAELAAGWEEYYEGQAAYADGLAEFTAQIAEAEAEIDDAQAQIDALRAPTIYSLTRSSNSGYTSFESSSGIVSQLSVFLPVFFFLIAALVCSTTMTRMVDEARGTIGSLRAIGYSRGAIYAKYGIYASVAAASGCIAGFFFGGWAFPTVIWVAYGMLFNIPGFTFSYSMPLLAVDLLCSLLCSAGTAILACRSDMTGTPAALLRPKAPQPGKRIFLERITPLWRRLKFLHKVTLRNIFRFKKRMIMMILGISGCTALVVAAFGIRDSVTNIGNYQFDEIQKYDLQIVFSDPLSDELVEEIADSYAGIAALSACQMTTGTLLGPDAAKELYLAISDDESITSIFDLHLDSETIAYPGLGEVVITEKAASLAGVAVGDTVTISISDTERAEFVVSGIAENYVYNYIYLTGESYAAAFGQDYEPNILLVQAAEGADEYALGAQFSNRDDVQSTTVVTDLRATIDSMMQSMDYVVALVLGSACALAFVVLMNLGNINISERQREIATIKVLGFHARETGSYVFRESLLLSLMGIAVGLPLGVLLHRFIIDQIVLDMVSFKYEIEPLSFVLSALLVLLFTLLTDIVMRRKIAAIHMAESLKSVE